MIRFTVPGIPAPGGSKRAFYNKRTGRAMLTDDCRRNAPWRAAVAWTAKKYISEPLAGPILVEVEFRLPRPKGHYRTGRNKHLLRDGAPRYPITKPDATKLWRAAEDALKGIAWLDDSQVVSQRVQKAYGTPGMVIVICGLEDSVSPAVADSIDEVAAAIGVTI